MVCEPDLITNGEAMYTEYIEITSDWYRIGRDYQNQRDWGGILDFQSSTFRIMDFCQAPV